MTSTISTQLQDATCSFEEVINLANAAMANMLRQVIAFQQTIFTRTENPGVPSLQELTFQGKMINAIDKLRRFQGRNSKLAGITGFVRFVSNKDSSLSKTMLTHYNEYAEKKQRASQDTQAEKVMAANVEAAAEPHAAKLSTAILPCHTASPANCGEPVEGESGTKNIYSTTPPTEITEAIFDKYKDFIGTSKDHPIDTVLSIRGIDRYVNFRWFDYNLYQFELPVEERRFIAEEQAYHQEVDHKAFHKKLQPYLQQLKRKAA